MPPALNVPVRVTDLSAVERGSTIEVAFTIPAVTTDNLKVLEATPDLRIQEAPGGNVAVPEWAPKATRVPVGVKPAGRVTVPVDAAAYAGKTVVIAVRLAGRKGRLSEWSSPFVLAVIPPLSKPGPVKTEATAQGIRLSWPASNVAGASYRVYRQGPADAEMTVLATVTEPSYADTTAQYDVAYRYQVQAVKEGGESDRSDVAAFTAVDTFAPAVPTGLSASAGINTIELNWERNTDPDFAEFRVYRAEAGGAPVKIAEKVLTPVYTDRQLTSGKRYQYTVTAVDRKNNESAPSAGAEAVAP